MKTKAKKSDEYELERKKTVGEVERIKVILERKLKRRAALEKECLKLSNRELFLNRKKGLLEGLLTIEASDNKDEI